MVQISHLIKYALAATDNVFISSNQSLDFFLIALERQAIHYGRPEHFGRRAEISWHKGPGNLLLLSGVSGANDPLKAHPVKQEMIPIDRTLLTMLRSKERVRMKETVHAHGITLESATYWKYETICI